MPPPFRTPPAWLCRRCGSAVLLARDRCYQLCAAEERRVVAAPLGVHHRRPGVNRLPLQIALCPRCHVRLHRRRQLPGVYSDVFFRLWRELHPGVPAQLRLPLAV